MLPEIVTPSKLRKNLAKYLELAQYKVVLVKDKKSNKVILGEKDFNRIVALAQTLIEEDPEGKYQKNFIEEMLNRSKNPDFDDTVKSFKDLM